MAVQKFWLNDLDSKEKKEKYIQVLKSSPELKTLKRELEKALSSLDKQRRDLTNYDKPCWSQLQADLIGQERSLTSVLNWLSFD